LLKLKKKLGLLKTLGAALPSTQFPPRAGVNGNKGLAGWNPKPDPKGFLHGLKKLCF